MKMFRFCVVNGSSAGADPLGGAVPSGNAAFLMSAWIKGPELDALEVGEAQTREATTADGYTHESFPGTRTEFKKARIRYRVTREV